MIHRTETLELRWTSKRLLRLTGKCLVCGLEADAVRPEEQFLLDQTPDPRSNRVVRASMTRAVIAMLRTQGCAHAVHDRVALTDCIMRPDHLGYGLALGALLELDEKDIRAILSEKTHAFDWRPSSVVVSWSETALLEVTSKLHCDRAHSRVRVSVELEPAELWELLVARGLVPVQWLGDGVRGFRTNVEQLIEPPATPANRVVWRQANEVVAKPVRHVVDEAKSVPHTLRDCIALASDGPGITAAESLVREVVKRLNVWGLPDLSKISWRTVDASCWRTVRRSWWTQSLQWTIASALEASAYQLPLGHGPKDPAGRPSWWSLAANESSLAQLWEHLALAHVVRADPVAQINRSFESLLNPYEPLMAIWSTGYVFDEFRDGEAILVAPYV